MTSFRDYIAGQERMIAEYGWSVLVIPDAEHPFGYTIGLAELVGVELVIRGLRPELLGSVLNATARQIVDELGPELVATCHERGTEVSFDHVLEGYLVAVRPAAQAEWPICAAEDRWSGARRATYGVGPAGHADPLRVWQVVWPDPDGNLPGAPECNPLYVIAQQAPGRDEVAA